MTTVTLPPGPTARRATQAAYALLMPRRGMDRMRRRFGDAFTVNVPAFGHSLVISNPAEIKQLFTASTDQVDNMEVNLGRILGPGSLFALDGEAHHRQRKLLVPPFHGRRLVAYEQIVEEETVREMATWPQGQPFPTLPSTMRITLNIILRAVFGADGAELAELRELLPRAIVHGSRLAILPIPKVDFGRWSPWGRFFAMRRQYDAIIDRLVAKAERDPDLDRRDDVLAMMLQSRYDDGTRMSRSELADQLLTLLAAGHETTATTLAWVVERLRRHPDVLRQLVEEVDAGGSALREATIIEVQRSRPVIDLVGRQVKVDGYQLGRWCLPKGYPVLVSIALIHDDEALFPDAHRFDPTRFLGKRPDLYEWIPFGGGSRRCLGAAFASMEMNVVLRTMLRDVTLVPTDEPGERFHNRGVAFAPRKGGRAVIRRRTAQPAPPAATTAAATHP
ncbi:MAG TPA: cytochrome P450 [Rugosimonospora sp.]|nr:cytochrome P450 [Rugosimonospora sp.]